MFGRRVAQPLLRPWPTFRPCASFTSISRGDAARLLKKSGIDVATRSRTPARTPAMGKFSRHGPLFSLKIDRARQQPILEIEYDDTVMIPLRYSSKLLSTSAFKDVSGAMRYGLTELQQLQLTVYLDRLWMFFKEGELTELAFGVALDFDDVQVVVSSMKVDTDALKRQPVMAKLVKIDERTVLEQQAEAAGLIYTQLDGDIGCIVNGAGLAMATNDILHQLGGRSANFLDTGGQATTALLVTAFRLLLSDARVKAILINIYGGIIRCDMIAESIILAAKELDLQGLPIVVRLRGTNAEEGQRMIAESGLQLFSEDAVDTAAHRVIQLAAKAIKRPVMSMSSPTGSQARAYSTSRRLTDRAERTRSLDLTSDTRVIYQGFTGKQGTKNATETIAYGTNIVGGVSPGKGGRMHLDLPVFNTVREACDSVKPDATAIFVPAYLAASAIMEAIEMEMPLIVSVAENIPVHDMLRVHEMLRTTKRSRLVGPNCPGVIVPSARCRIGIMPYKQFSPGRIGIVSKSGTLSYEAVGETTRLGLGQSMVFGMGGDMLPGTSLVEGLRLFAERNDTDAMICLGEIGGEAELEAAAFVRDYRAKLGDAAKPIVAMVAGWTAPEGRVMGHAGALQMPGELTAEAKTEILRGAGCHIACHTGELGVLLQSLLK